MKRRISALLFVLIVLSLFACKKTVTIGTKTIDVSKKFTIFISQSAEKDSLDQMRKGFVKGMVEKGYVENVNVTYIYENAKADNNVASKIADLAVEKKPDLIVGIGDISMIALKEKVSDIPIVFIGCADADRIGLCNKDLSPIGNITGVTDSHLLDESLKFISENYSDVKKLGVIYDSNNSLSTYNIDYLKFYATGYDIDIYTVAIKKANDVGKAIDNIFPKVNAIFFISDDMINQSSAEILAKFNTASKLAFAVKGEVVGDSLIYTAEPDRELVGYEASDIVSTILKGEKKLNDINVRKVTFN